MNHANFIFAYFEFRASLNLWLGAIRRRCSSRCCVGERETAPLHGAHLLIIRIPKATAEIRREKGIDAYGPEGAEHATRAITHYKNPRVADGYVGP